MFAKVLVVLALVGCTQAFRLTPKVKKAPADVPKALVGGKAKMQTKTTMMLGPFDSAADACDYCHGSYTKTGVVATCVCMAYEGDGSAADKPAGWTMFCSATIQGANYVKSMGDSACRCKQNDQAALGKTTCSPF